MRKDETYDVLDVSQGNISALTLKLHGEWGGVGGNPLGLIKESIFG